MSSVKPLFLWLNPIDHKYKVIDTAGFVFGDSTDPQKAVNMAVNLGISPSEIDTEGIL